MCEENAELALEIEKSLLDAKEYITDENVDVLVLNNVLDMVEYAESGELLIDGVFINMDCEYQYGGNGIQVGEFIRKSCKRANILFYTETGMLREEIFDIEPLYVLGLPLCADKLKKALLKLVENVKRNYKESFVIKAVNGFYRVNRNDVKYIESEGRHVNIYTGDEMIISNNKIKEVMMLLGDGFMQCHKSFAVNLKRIKRLERSMVVLWDGTEIQVSRKYQSAIRDVMTRNR